MIVVVQRRLVLPARPAWLAGATGTSAAATAMFASQRAGVATVLLFFVVGGGLLLAVNERDGIAAARAE